MKKLSKGKKKIIPLKMKRLRVPVYRQRIKGHEK